MAVLFFSFFFFSLSVRYTESRDWRGDIFGTRPEATLHLRSVPQPVAVTRAYPRPQRQTRPKNSLTLTRKSTCRLAKVRSAADREVSSKCDESLSHTPSLLNFLFFSSASFFLPGFVSSPEDRPLGSAASASLDFLLILLICSGAGRALSPSLSAGCLCKPLCHSPPQLLCSASFLFFFWGGSGRCIAFHVVHNNTPAVMWHLE